MPSEHWTGDKLQAIRNMVATHLASPDDEVGKVRCGASVRRRRRNPDYGCAPLPTDSGARRRTLVQPVCTTMFAMRVSTGSRQLGSILLMASLLLVGFARFDTPCAHGGERWVTGRSHAGSVDPHCVATPAGRGSNTASTVRCAAMSLCASIPAVPVTSTVLAVLSTPRLRPTAPPPFHSEPAQAPELPPPRA